MKQKLDSVTEDDLNMIAYFILERGNITRWSQWEERKPVIAKEFPELLAALDALTVAERTVRAIVQNMKITVTENERRNDSEPLSSRPGNWR